MIKFSKKSMELVDDNTLNLFEVPVIGNYRLSKQNDDQIEKFVHFIKEKLCNENSSNELHIKLFPHRISGDNYLSIEVSNKNNEELNFLIHIRGDKLGPYWPEDSDWSSIRVPISLGDAIDSLFFLDELSRRLGIQSS